MPVVFFRWHIFSNDKGFEMRKRKLLLQIGTVVSFVFVLLMIVAEKYIFKKSTEVYLEAENEMISSDLLYFRNKLKDHLFLDVEEYWVNNQGKVSEDINDDELDVVFESYSGDARKDEETFRTMNDSQKLAIAKNIKNSLSSDFYYYMKSRNYYNVYILYPVGDGFAFVIGADRNSDDTIWNGSDSEENQSITDAESETKYKFADVVPFDLGEQRDESDLANKKDNEIYFADSINYINGKAYYSGYIPIYDYKNEFLGVLCAEYDWSDAYSTILDSSKYKLITDMLIGLFLLAGVVLMCLYIMAVRPLRETKEALDQYKITKNSDDVERMLSGIRSKNEIGQFADNVKELSKEIDRYNEENIELAKATAKVKTELDMAATIQGDSLIKDFPKSSYYEVYASMTPAKEVGGDFYDVFDIDDAHTVFVIADVSGKGMPAALFMMAAMTSIRNYSVSGCKPSEIITKVNEELVNRNIMDMFVTIWLGILDKNTGVLTTSNAGHEYPAVNTTGSFELFKDKHGFVAGGMSGVKYTDQEIHLSKGDIVFVYTDGVPEATNSKVEMYTDKRMLEALNKKSSASPEELLAIVKSSVDEFVGEAEQFDDLTMLCIKYNG